MSCEAEHPAGLTVRRGRPLLGTIVDIRATAAFDPTEAVEEAFAAIETVGRLMSFHDPQSDLRRLNREAPHSAVSVHPWTREVLEFSLQLGRMSGWAFDIAVGAELVQWEYLPETDAGRCRGSARDIRLLEDGNVQFSAPLTIDLGGVAKGFAVDKAIEVLHRFGVRSAVVNAGGDLRLFGPDPEIIHVRDPALDGAYVAALAIENAACATSSSSLSRRELSGGQVSPHVCGKSRQPICDPVSITVRAAECMIADALTKLVLADSSELPEILSSFSATAYKVSHGEVFILGETQ